MKISQSQLTQLETDKGIILIQSTFPDLVYAVDKHNRVVWEMYLNTGASIPKAFGDIHKQANELMDISDLYINSKSLWRR